MFKCLTKMPGVPSSGNSLDEFKALTIGKVIEEVRAGHSRDGGDYLTLRLTNPETGKQEVVTLQVGTIYGNLMFKTQSK